MEMAYTYLSVCFFFVYSMWKENIVYKAQCEPELNQFAVIYAEVICLLRQLVSKWCLYELHLEASSSLNAAIQMARHASKHSVHRKGKGQ